jgi:hypothetical protein
MLAIVNYGRFWRRDKVFWGRGKNKGHLKGQLKGQKTIVVDFRFQIGIYVLFDANRRPIYIGQAGMGNARLFGRLKQHQRDHLRDRWTLFSWYGLRGYNEGNQKLSEHHTPDSWVKNRKRRDALHETEAVLISVIEPPSNRRGPNWVETKEFHQFIDERVPLDVGEIVRQLPKRLAKIEEILEEWDEDE